MAVMDFRESNRTKSSFIISKLWERVTEKLIFHNYDVLDKDHRIFIFYPILCTNQLARATKHHETTHIRSMNINYSKLSMK